MKIAYMTGAYVNAGDFLIEERTKRLILDRNKDIEILTFYRNDIPNNMEAVNSCDAMVFGGGPIYMNDLENYLHLSEWTDKLRVPIMIIGGGWYGNGGG